MFKCLYFLKFPLSPLPKLEKRSFEPSVYFWWPGSVPLEGFSRVGIVPGIKLGLAELQPLSSALKSAFSRSFVPRAGDSPWVLGVLPGAAQFQPGLGEIKSAECDTYPALWGVEILILSLLFGE